MGILRRHRRVPGWLAVLALLSNLLTMALLAPAAAAGARAHVDEILGPLVLCTADGAKTAVPDGGGSGGRTPSDHCRACLTVAPYALAVAIVLTAIDFPKPPAARPAVLQSRSPAAHLARGGIRSRAPPLPA